MEIVGNKLLIDGFVFIRSKTIKGRTYWDCNRLHQREYSARAISLIQEDSNVLS